MIATTVHERRDPAVAEAWQALEAAGGGTLMTSWRWTATWLEHFGDDVAHHLLLCQEGGTPVGAALVTRSRRRTGRLPPVRRLHLGTAGEPPGGGVYVERNGLLARPDRRGQVAAALLAAIGRLPAWDELVLDGFTPDDAALIGQALPLRTETAACRTLDLAAVRAESRTVLDTLPSSVRARIRRSVRGFGTLATEWAETVDAGLDILDELIALHQVRWRAAGADGAFASERVRRFHRALVAELLPRGGVVLFRVRSGEETVGCLYLHADGRELLFYQSGLAAFADNRLRPGLVAHERCMQEAADRGFDLYDLLAGDSRYKRDLGPATRPLVWASARRRTARTAIDRAARALARRSPASTGAPADAVVAKPAARAVRAPSAPVAGEDAAGRRDRVA